MYFIDLQTNLHVILLYLLDKLLFTGFYIAKISRNSLTVNSSFFIHNNLSLFDKYISHNPYLIHIQYSYIIHHTVI